MLSLLLPRRRPEQDLRVNKPVIIYRLGSLGDTVITLPCFHQIARAYPDRDKIVVTNHPVSGVAPALEAVLGGSGLINKVISYNVGERSRANLIRLMLKIRATGAREMVYLAAGRGIDTIKRDLKFFRYCGIKKVIGAPLTDDLHYNRFYPDTGDIEPETERLARTIEALGPIDLKDRVNWDLGLTQYEHAAADRALEPLGGKPFFAISIGTKLEINNWGKENWTALLEALAEPLGDLTLVGIGAPDDFSATERILRRWQGNMLNLCGPLSPRQSAAVLSRASLFLGHDSGPMHLAAAAGAPALGLFGNNNPPRKWHPYAPGCRAIHNMKGVDKISVAEVRDAALELRR